MLVVLNLFLKYVLLERLFVLIFLYEIFIILDLRKYILVLSFFLCIIMLFFRYILKLSLVIMVDIKFGLVL